MKLFLSAFLQVYLVSINTILLSKNKIELSMLVSFFISWFWFGNSNKAKDYTLRNRFIYSFGASFGALCGILSINLLTNLFN